MTRLSNDDMSKLMIAKVVVNNESHNLELRAPKLDCPPLVSNIFGGLVSVFAVLAAIAVMIGNIMSDARAANRTLLEKDDATAIVMAGTILVAIGEYMFDNDMHEPASQDNVAILRQGEATTPSDIPSAAVLVVIGWWLILFAISRVDKRKRV